MLDDEYTINLEDYGRLSLDGLFPQTPEFIYDESDIRHSPLPLYFRDISGELFDVD